MELAKKQKDALVTQDAPHIWEVRIPNHPNGVPKMHCGTLRDAQMIMEKYPDATLTKIFLPGPPQTVNIEATSLGHEEQLEEAVPSLPQSDQIELNL